MATILSWNEIRDRATKFAREWKDETRETGEYQTFWNEFFEVFGVRRRSVAIYQKAVERINGNHGFIDLFWPGKLIVEHKTAGKDLDSAFLQAADYMLGLAESERPRYIIVSDYQRIRLYDLEGESGETESQEFSLSEFVKNIRVFAFISGYDIRKYRESDPVNRRAVRLVVDLYNALENGMYPKEHLSKLLVRLVFCFFADDTAIFPPDSFYNYLFYASHEDGHDFGAHLGTVFQILNTKENERQTHLDEDLLALPYVNGGLFAEPLPLPFFNREMRASVLKATEFDWSSVSPAIFGSMFQFVMDSDDESLRHDFGAHYTSEKNILKLVDGLFMDELRKKLDEAGQNPSKLKSIWEELGRITLLDPACGCGNFLVVAYKELRRLEVEILKKLYKKEIDNQLQALPLDVTHLSKISVERMFGIEILPFPAEIARLSLWLADHLSNIELGDLFGKPFAKLPLLEQPHILRENALTTDWARLVSKENLTYIFGNPPFLGSRLMDESQRKDMYEVFGKIKELGFLDYVTAWYMKAARYIQDTRIKCAFVSTNSISQGEQVGILWHELQKLGIRIHFAHRTFKWSNEAPGQAGVYCVIIGFAAFYPEHPALFDYADVSGEPHEIRVNTINPYLVDAPEAVILRNRQQPLCDVPNMSFGNMPRDGGILILDAGEKEKLVEAEPNSEKFIKTYMGAREFLHGESRWCLWLVNAQPEELRAMPEVMRRVNGVKVFREMSRAASTRSMSATPSLFAQRTQPELDYILIPRVSSENRRYVPMGFLAKDIIVSDSCLAISGAGLYHFGVLESEMHMTWMRAVCGRLESRYRYSKDIVYNNFPWPENISSDDVKTIELAAQEVLNARGAHADATLADLYDPLSMPEDLLDAHRKLDHAVDHAYGIRNFESEAKRLEFLFGLYQKYLGPEPEEIKIVEQNTKN